MALVLLFALTIFPTTLLYAQSSDLNQAQSDRAKLESELAQLEAEIQQKQNDLNNQKGKSATLSNDIALLKTQIDKAKLNIQAKSLVIKKLGGEIVDKNNHIESLNEKIDREKESLAQLIRQTNDINQSNVLHVILSEQSLSQFYGDLDAFASIKQSIRQSVDTIRNDQNETMTERTLLEKKQNQELDAKAAIEQAKKQVEVSEAQQKQLLSISKNKEKEYQVILADRAKRAGQIRAALFQLAGGGAAIPFERALTYAEDASNATGVRPAFLLAILYQESNLGANQGKCYLTVPETGVGVRVSTGALVSNVMKPSRDVGPFIQITKELGIDPFKQVVSCPIDGGGYGGGMGPSQFIPSTWNLLKNRIANMLGVGTPNPWSPRDAFFASGIYLSDLGGAGSVYSSERNAACRYYSGRKCDSKRPANSFYGNSVMSKAASIQSDIDYLKQYGVSRR